MAIRPIVKGDQLVYNYHGSYRTKPRIERQLYYKEEYGFQCKCVACVKDYPLELALPVKKGLVLNMAEIMRSDRCWEQAKLEKYVKDHCDYLQKNDKFYPCMQLNVVHRQIHVAYLRLLGRDAWEQKFRA